MITLTPPPPPSSRCLALPPALSSPLSTTVTHSSLLASPSVQQHLSLHLQRIATSRLGSRFPPKHFLCFDPAFRSAPNQNAATLLPAKHSTTSLKMSNFHYGAPHYPPAMAAHTHNHHGRSRRGPRVSSAQNAHRHQFSKVQRSPKEMPENPAYSAYMKDLEAAKSFEFEDDEIFCPFHLLTEDDVRPPLPSEFSLIFTSDMCCYSCTLSTPHPLPIARPSPLALPKARHSNTKRNLPLPLSSRQRQMRLTTPLFSKTTCSTR